MTQTLRPPSLLPGPLICFGDEEFLAFNAIFLILRHRYGLDTDDSQQPNKAYRRSSEASKISYPQSGDVYYREKNGVSRQAAAPRESPNDLETGRPHPPHLVDDGDFEPSGSMRAKTSLELAVEKNAQNNNEYELIETSEQFHLFELPSGANGEVNSAFEN